MYTEKIFKKTWTCQEVYGKQFHELKASDGWEFTGEFRPPVGKDAYLSVDRNDSLDFVIYFGDNSQPRLILRKQEVPDYYLKYDGVRCPQFGELYEAKDGLYYIWPLNDGHITCCHVWKKYPIDPLTKRPDFGTMTGK